MFLILIFIIHLPIIYCTNKKYYSQEIIINNQINTVTKNSIYHKMVRKLIYELRCKLVVIDW